MACNGPSPRLPLQAELAEAQEKAAKLSELEASGAGAARRSSHCREQLSRLRIAKSRIDNIAMQAYAASAAPFPLSSPRAPTALHLTLSGSIHDSVLPWFLDPLLPNECVPSRGLSSCFRLRRSVGCRPSQSQPLSLLSALPAPFLSVFLPSGRRGLISTRIILPAGAGQGQEAPERGGSHHRSVQQRRQGPRGAPPPLVTFTPLSFASLAVLPFPLTPLAAILRLLPLPVSPLGPTSQCFACLLVSHTSCHFPAFSVPATSLRVIEIPYLAVLSLSTALVCRVLYHVPLYPLPRLATSLQILWLIPSPLAQAEHGESMALMERGMSAVQRRQAAEEKLAALHLQLQAAAAAVPNVPIKDPVVDALESQLAKKETEVAAALSQALGYAKQVQARESMGRDDVAGAPLGETEGCLQLISFACRRSCCGPRCPPFSCFPPRRPWPRSPRPTKPCRR